MSVPIDRSSTCTVWTRPPPRPWSTTSRIRSSAGYRRSRDDRIASFAQSRHYGGVFDFLDCASGHDNRAPAVGAGLRRSLCGAGYAVGISGDGWRTNLCYHRTAGVSRCRVRVGAVRLHRHVRTRGFSRAQRGKPSMNTVLTLASLLLHFAGLIFLFAAALGLLRFKDALQRMHASAKAGTIGAGLVLLGAVITMDNLEGVIIGLLTVLFLLLTVPVAGHLLGRAAYLSGADLLGLEGKDALSGVLPRYPQPLEQRDQGATTESAPRLIVSMPPIAEIRFVIIPPYEKRVAERALTLSIRNGVPIEAKVILDRGAIEV